VPVVSLLSPVLLGVAELVPEPPAPREDLSLFDLSFDLSSILDGDDELLVLELPVLPEVCADAASGTLPAAKQPIITIRLSHRVVMYCSPWVDYLGKSITLARAKETPGSPGGLVGHTVKDCCAAGSVGGR
jgi:hypothetical protein